MTIHELKTMHPQVMVSAADREVLNSLAISRAITTLSGKLEALGVAELRWHTTVSSYEAAVANSHKRVVGEYFREDLNTLPPGRFFGITGHDDTGRTVCTSANRYDDIAGWDLCEYLQKFWNRNYEAEGGGYARLAPESIPFARGVTGPFAYIGDTAVDPKFSGTEVAVYLVRLCILSCYMEWKPAQIYGWMTRRHVSRGLAFRWGFPIVWPGGFIWDVPPENKAYLELCFGLCPPQAVALIAETPLDIGAVVRPRNSKE